MWTDSTRRKHARKGLRYSSDLTDAEWAVLEPLVPAVSRLGRPPKWPRRTILNGMLYILRSGQPWRMLPGDFPPMTTVQHYFGTGRLTPLDRKPPSPIPNQAAAVASTHAWWASARNVRSVDRRIRCS